MSDPSLIRFRAVVEGALAHLESRRQEINDLNVFPVADGDTGDNMALTLRACLEELDRLATIEGRSIDEIGRDEIVDTVARAALLGARGNSGVILSQLIRGAAEELVSRPGRARRPDAHRRRHGPRRPARVRLGARAGGGHDAHRDARHGRRGGQRPRAHARPAPGPGRRRRRAERRDRRHPRARAGRGRAVGQARARAPPDPARRRASSTPAATASSSSSPASSRRCAATRRPSSSTTRPRASRTPSTPRRPSATARTSR